MGRWEDVGWVGGWGIIIRINGMEKLFSVKNITKAITKIMLRFRCKKVLSVWA